MTRLSAQVTRNGPRNAWLFGLGALTGVLGFGLVRFVSLRPDATTHFHANFALFVNDERLDLSADRYMEDVASCRVDPAQVEPRDRVHLHNHDANVVHVHAGATWGDLLANLGFGIGDDYLVTDRGERYFAAPDRTLKFVLNGSAVPGQFNERSDPASCAGSRKPAIQEKLRKAFWF